MKLISPIVEPEGRSVLPRYAVEVSGYDDSLEDIPTRQTYTSTEKHTDVDGLAAVLDEADEDQGDRFERV